MKVYSVSFQTILTALKHQRKYILISIFVFALLGMGAGALFSGRGMAEAGGSAFPLKSADISQLPRTRNYYNECLDTLDNTLSDLGNYLSAVTSYLPTDDPERNLELQDKLDDISKRGKLLESVQLAPIRSTLNEAGAVYTPEEYLDGLAQRSAQELETVRVDLIAAEAAVETIRQMDAPDYDGAFTSTYADLLYQASQYGTLLRRQAVYEKYLDHLEHHMPEVRAQCRQAERRLKEAADELNALLAEFLELADGVAKEEGLIFTPSYANKTMEILVTHTHRASSAGESFAVIVLFCVLTGLCFGAFLAVCREVKAEKRQSSAHPEQTEGTI